MKEKSLIYILCFFVILISGCVDKTHPLYPELLQIDSLAEEHPDRAASLLLQLPAGNKNRTQENNVFYGLLQTKIEILLEKKITSDSIINYVIDYYEKVHDDHLLSYAYFYKAKISLSSEVYSLAILYALKALDKAKSTGNLRLTAEIHDHLGSIYLFQNLPQNALQEFRKAYHLIDKIPQKYRYQTLFLRNMARAYNLGSILNPSKEHFQGDSAIIYYNKALMLRTDSTPRFISNSIFRELATVYMTKNDFPKAFEYLEASIDSSEMKVYYSRKADLFMRTDQLDSASFYIKKCMSDPQLYTKHSIYSKLLQIEKQRQNNRKALEYAETLLLISDSMIAHTIPEEMIEIQKKYSEEKLRAEKANLQVNYEKEKSHSLLVSFIVVVLLFLSTYIYIYGSFKKKKLQQSLLKQKNELLLLKQKTQQWNRQVELSQKKIQELESEKRQIESDFRIIAKEKESILKAKDEELSHYRKQEGDLLSQKAKYEEMCFVEFKKMFLSIPLSRKIPAFETEKVITDCLNPHSQKQLMNIMDEICSNFASRLYVLLQESTEKTCLCCLIKLQVKPRYIMILCNLSKEAYYKQCQRIAENLVGKSNAAALKDYLNSL